MFIFVTGTLSSKLCNNQIIKDIASKRIARLGLLCDILVHCLVFIITGYNTQAKNKTSCLMLVTHVPLKLNESVIYVDSCTANVNIDDPRRAKRILDNRLVVTSIQKKSVSLLQLAHSMIVSIMPCFPLRVFLRAPWIPSTNEKHTSHRCRWKRYYLERY